MSHRDKERWQIVALLALLGGIVWFSYEIDEWRQDRMAQRVADKMQEKPR